MDNSSKSPIAELIALAPPPDNPVCASGRFTWADIEAALGLSLPEDYKALIDAYGYGKFGGYLGLYNPFRYDTVADYVNTVTRFAVIVNENRKEYPEDYPPIDFYPDGPAVILGFTENAANLSCYSTRSAEGIIEWVVSTDADFSPNFGLYRKSLALFILGWVRGEFHPYGFPPEIDTGQKAAFIPGGDFR